MENQQHEYINTYLENLPIELRPDINERLKNALRDAWRNEWDPKTLAQTVAKSNYATAHSPAGVALTRLERYSKEKFKFAPNLISAYGTFVDAHCTRKGCPCTHKDCYRGWFDGGTKLVGIGNHVAEYEVTKPCQVCRPQTYENLNSLLASAF
jgi:hypothetical protein